MITHEQENKIREFVKDRPVELVYLFGSRANGAAKPLSDFDFAILFSHSLPDKERFELRLAAISFLTALFGKNEVDVLDLNLAPPALRFAAVAPRQNIYAKSEDARISFECRVMSAYFDQLYYLNRHTKQSLATIARQGLTR